MTNAAQSVEIGSAVETVETWNPRREGGNPTFSYIDIGCVSQDDKRIESTNEISADDAPSRARQKVRAGDVLVATVRPNLNAVALVPGDLDGATASTGFCVLRSDRRKLHPGFLYYWVRAPQFVGEVVRRATGANYPAVTDRIIKSSRIPGFSVAEQKRIAAILDKADAIRRKRQQAIALTEDLLRSTFLEMFGDPVLNPRGWPSACLGDGDLCYVKGGLQVTPKRASHPIVVRYLRVANVFRSRLDLAELKEFRVTAAELERTRLVGGDLLIVEGHGNPTEIGRSAVWDASIDPCSHQNHLIRVRVDEKLIDPYFLDAFINSAGGRRQLNRSGKTTSGLNTISISNVKSVVVPLPPIDLQQRYRRIVECIGVMAVRLGCASSTSADLFASLSQRAFRGDL